MKYLVYLLAFVSTVAFSQQNHNRWKGSNLERYEKAMSETGHKKIFNGSFKREVPSDYKRYNNREIFAIVENGIYDPENDIWYWKYDGRKNLNIIVYMAVSDSYGNFRLEPEYVYQTWKSGMNAYDDYIGAIWWTSDTWYHITDRTAQSARYNALRSDRNMQGAKIMDRNATIKISERAYYEKTNIAPDGRSMFGYARKGKVNQDDVEFFDYISSHIPGWKYTNDHRPYKTKGIFRVDRALIGKTINVKGQLREDGKGALFNLPLKIKII